MPPIDLIDTLKLLSDTTIKSKVLSLLNLRAHSSCRASRVLSGFYDGEFLDYLEMKKIAYPIVVKLYPWIQMELVGPKYRDIGGGVSVSEMLYTGIGWKEPRRMVVIREEEREDKKKK